MPTLRFRADDELVRALDDEAARAGVPRSDLLARALRDLLSRLRCERDAEIYARIPLSADELWGSEVAVWPDDVTEWTDVFGPA